MPRTRASDPVPTEITSMQKPKKEPEPPSCSCGRSRSEASVSSFHSQASLFTFHRCECGLEWTEHAVSVDRSQPVTTDDVIMVYVWLARFEDPMIESQGLTLAQL